MVESPEPRHVVSGPPGPGAHTLGPHVVGRRVVVRRVLPGETGPSGGPALTDVLGVCRSWGRGLCEVEKEDGTLVAIHVGDIVSGKPVPPRPSVRLRIPPVDLHRHSLAMFPRMEREQLGEWVLRATPWSERARAGSVLAMGDPGLPVEEAAERVLGFYAARGRRPWAQVLVDGDVDRALTSLGWVPARPDEADSLVQVASVAGVLRAAGRVGSSWDGSPGVVLEEDRAGAVARLVVGSQEMGRARAAAPPDVSGDLVGLHDVRVEESHRRRGIGAALTLTLLDWAASRGATTAYLQVVSDHHAATGLYERLGFVTHHAYRYLEPAPPGTP